MQKLSNGTPSEKFQKIINWGMATLGTIGYNTNSLVWVSEKGEVVSAHVNSYGVFSLKINGITTTIEANPDLLVKEFAALVNSLSEE